jgi:hypothetical protein
MKKLGITVRQAGYTCWAGKKGSIQGMKVVFGQPSPLLPSCTLAYYITSGCRRFPPARVWPPLPTDKRYNALITGAEGDEHLSKLPDPETQDHLLDLYFTYVHPSLPVVHKKAFLDIFRQV